MTVSILVISARVAVITRSQNLVISAVIHSPNIDGSDRGDRVGAVAADLQLEDGMPLSLRKEHALLAVFVGKYMPPDKASFARCRKESPSGGGAEA